MTCMDYLLVLWEDGTFSTWASDQYWNGGVDTADLFESMIKAAARDGITLTDVDTWDYDEPLYISYNEDTEKGLS
jgi:hypothetical protein